MCSKLPFFGGLLLLALPAHGADFVVQPETSYVDIRVYKAGLASAFAHNHVMHAEKLAGTMRYDQENRHTTALEMVISAKNIVVDPPKVRARYGMEPLDPDDIEEIEENMKAEDQLHVARYPKMTFVSTGAVATKTGARIDGKLTIRGVTKSVSVNAKIEVNGDRLAGTARLRVRHQDFGFEPFSAMLGAIRNQEKLDLIIVVDAKRKAPTALPSKAGEKVNDENIAEPSRAPSPEQSKKLPDPSAS